MFVIVVCVIYMSLSVESNSALSLLGRNINVIGFTFVPKYLYSSNFKATSAIVYLINCSVVSRC